MVNQIIIYPYVQQILEAPNRITRRDADQELKRIVEKLDKIHHDFCHIVTTQENFDYDALFSVYNENFQNMVDKLQSKIKYHAIHRGWFYMMFHPEKLGKVRHEERGKTNSLSNLVNQIKSKIKKA